MPVLIEQISVAARAREPKALDLDAFSDRLMDFALLTVGAMAVAVVIALILELSGLTWSISLLVVQSGHLRRSIQCAPSLLLPD